MSSPCVSCNSYPCACSKVMLDQGRYSYQPNLHCIICFHTPCVCNAQDYQNSTADAYCIGCSTKPCICPGTVMSECYCGQCSDCNVWVSDDNWIHRSQGMVCSTCMWWVPKAEKEFGVGEIVLGRCRKKAPTLDGWPAVYANDWCGDHKLDETKI